ncbi:MAG: tetratricopeptide repeat protein [Symbiopectobacterium sp.]|uniref:tetratricopeptide repeat protein n=1 Tax=Symbiopectobacterium sp. TaxID=2952789 RepID=UPI0039EBCF06
MKKRLLSVLLLCTVSALFTAHAASTTALPPDVKAIYDEDTDLVKRVEQGDLEAQNRLAYNLTTRGSADAWKEGFVWLKRAADGGHVPSQFAVGKTYFTSKRIPHDPQQGQAYLTKAAEDNMPIAQMALASLLADGKVLKKDDKQAALWANRLLNNAKASENHKKTAQDILDSLKNG